MVEKNIWTFDTLSYSHLSFLRFCALIPFDGQSFDYIGTRLLSIYCHLMNLVYNTMFSGYGVRMIARKAFEVDYICEIMIVEAVSLRYFLLYFKREQLIRLIQSCRELWTHLTAEETRVVRNFERKAHYFRTFMLVNGLAVVVLFIATARFVKLPPAEVNGTERKMMAFRFYVDVQEEPMYTAVTIIQGVVCTTIPFIIAGIETVGLYLILMACGYLRSVQNRLVSMRTRERITIPWQVEGSPIRDVNKSIFEEVLVCAKFHQKIMVFCEDIEKFTRTVFLIIVFTTTYNMSLTGLKILENDENKFKFVAILILNLFQFFTCQWSPEYLLTESQAIGNAAYFASLEQDQSQYKEKTNRLLLLIMVRTQRPIQLTAGGYIKLSIETFGNMVKSAFSFFAVLRSFSS